MTSYLSSWWPSFSRAEEVVATDTTTEDKDSIEVDASSSRQESPLVSTTNEASDSAETEESATGTTTTTTTNNQNPTPNGPAGPSRPEKKDTFKIPALPTSRPPSQSIASTSSLIPPPIPSRQGPAPIAKPRKEEDIDAAPQFPLPDSAQRSRPAASSVPSFDVRPPSPDQEDEDEPASDLNIAILPGTVPLGNMAPPPSTTARPAFGMQKGAEQPTKAKRREKVALGPGYSPLDWARLTQSGRNLRGVEGPKRVTLEELSQHSSQYDAWMALDGIVYNITPYVRFHPGGGKELLRGAGRDGTKLFMNTHSWVNYTHMLQECIIGPLVRK